MSGMYLLASILCLAVGSSLGSVIEGNYNVTSYCTLVKLGTSLGSIESCDYYYVCTSSGPVKTNCQQGYSYNSKAGSCQPSNQVNCYYGVENVCASVTGERWVPVSGTCNQYFYCKNGQKVGKGSCGSYTFSESAQECVYPLCNNVGLTTGPNLISPCDVIPASTYFGSTKDCSTYNYCYPNGNLATSQCSTSAFIVSSGSCGYNEGNNCDRVVSESGSSSESCTAIGDMKPDDNVCGNYLYCDGANYVEKSCPNGQYFDVTKSTCLNRQTATPAKGCNRCQYATNPFVNNVNTEYCNTYYYCNNGKPDVVTTCPSQFFFDEELQGCAADSGVVKYAVLNGACAGAIEQPQTTTESNTTDASTETPNSRETTSSEETTT